MGYVAELQQFDPVPPSVYELDPPADTHAPAPVSQELVYSPATDTFFSAPEAEPPPIASHVRPEPAGRRMRAVVLSAAILAIISGVGIGYAAWDTTGGTPSAQAPGAASSAAPEAGRLELEPALPGVDPVTGAATGPATTPPAAPTTAARVAPLPVHVPEETSAPAVPGSPDRPEATAEPTEPEPAETSDTPEATDPVALPPRPLPPTAVLTYAAEQGEDGVTGYTATVRVTNPNGVPNRGWTVSLTVPGANAVTASGARVAQDGESVTFTGEPIAAGETFTFTFAVDGTLPALPGGCRIDGLACS